MSLQQNMEVIRRKLRGKQMMIEGLQSENAILRQSLFYKNRATQVQNSQETSSSNVLQSSNPVGGLVVPSNHCLTQPQGHSKEQRNHKTQVPHEKQIRQPLEDKQYAIYQRQQLQMPSSSQAQKLPTQSSGRYTHQDQYPAADLEEIESFFHNIEHQLQSSHNEGNNIQSAVKSRQTQPSSNQTNSREQIETNVEVTYVTSVRTVQTQKRTPNLQPIQIDQGNKPCRTVPQQNLQRSSLPTQTYNTLTHNLQTLQYPSQQSVQGLQSVNKVHTNSTQKQLLPQHSPQQHFVKGPQSHEHLHKNLSTNLQLPNSSPQLFLGQSHRNPQQFHNSLPQSHHSMQHSPQTHFQKPNNPQQIPSNASHNVHPQQIPNNASHNAHPPLQSSQSQIQRFNNPQQMQNNANYYVQPSHQHHQWASFVQQPIGNSTYRSQPPQHSPQQPFQGSSNLKVPQHSPSIGPMPQQAKSIQEYSTSQQIIQRQHLPPSQFGHQQSISNVQSNPPPLQRPNLLSENLHRPQLSPQNQELRPQNARVMPPPIYRAPFLPQQNQQLNVTPQHAQGVSSSSQQMSLSHGHEQARYGVLNQSLGSQKSPRGSSAKRGKKIIKDKRSSDPSSIQNPVGHTLTLHSNSTDPPQLNKEPHITQPQSSPSNNDIERHKNLSSPVTESNQNVVLRNQQDSDSLPSTSTVHNNSCVQNEGVSDNEKAIEIQKKISAVMCQEEESVLGETGTESTNYVEGPFLEIVKEEPVSDLPDTSVGTSHQWSNVGNKISVEDSLGVSEFFHLEEITASVPVAKLSNRPEIVSGPKKRISARESSLDRNTDIPPQSIITPPQTPPTPIPSTSARGGSPGLSINATQIMKALAYQASNHSMVDSDVTYCNAVQDNENNVPVPNNVSDETKAPSDSLQTLVSAVLQRNESNESASFSSISKTTDTSLGNLGEDSVSKTSEKGSDELVEKISLENDKSDPPGISDHATGLASPKPDDGIRLTEAPGNSLQEELQDQEPIASKISGCREFPFPKHRNSQESRDSTEEISSLEQACKEEMCLEQAITPSVPSNIECSEVSPSCSSEIDKPSGNSFEKEGNNEDQLQPVRYKECETNSIDSDEKSQQFEYLIETVESDTEERGNCSSLLENSLSDLDGLVEYVHISDYPDESEKKFSPKCEEHVDEQTDCEVSHYESNVTERMWRIENDLTRDYDNENNDNVLEIFLSIDEVTGKLTEQKKIPECCPLCYTDICPSTITVSAGTFDMKAICIGCNLTILMIWGSKPKDNIEEERPCPKSKKRRLNSVPKLLFIRQ